jgi:hypothetical protein
MKSASTVMLKDSMSLHQACNALNQLEDGKIRRVQDLTSKNGEMVVFLRRPTLKESLIHALMPDAMRREANHPAFAVLKEVAVKSGIDPSSTLLKNVKDAIEGGNGNALRDALFRLQLSSSNREHSDLF